MDARDWPRRSPESPTSATTSTTSHASQMVGWPVAVSRRTRSCWPLRALILHPSGGARCRARTGRARPRREGGHGVTRTTDRPHEQPSRSDPARHRRRSARLRDRRDRHQPQRRRSTSPSTLIDVAAEAGCQAVKFQKRTPEICVPPEHMRDVLRETPWGTMTYLEYRYRVEFGRDEYVEIAEHYAMLRGLDWFASPWDVPSVDVPRGSQRVARTRSRRRASPISSCSRRSSTRASRSSSRRACRRIEQIDARGRNPRHRRGSSHARDLDVSAAARRSQPAHDPHARGTATACRSATPVTSAGLQISLAAVALGAVAVERHITLDRTMWGSDHAASLEPAGSEPWCATSASSSEPWATA